MPDAGVTSRLGRALCGLVVALIVTVSTAACSNSSDDGGGSRPTSGSGVARSVPPDVRVVKVTGRLAKAKRRTVRTRADAAIDGWWRAAYLSSGASNPFPGFTAGAAKLAKGDRDLLSNAAFGDKVTGGVAVRRAVDLDVLAVKGRAVGVTARLHLAYDTTGRAHRRCVVGGTVSLVPQGKRWRIFGYDVTHSCHAPAKPSAAPSTTPRSAGSETSR